MENRQKENLIYDPPSKSKWLLSDINNYFINNPKISTLINFKSKTDRHEYSHRIMQRIEMDVTKYSVLNIHRIGIDAPVNFVFEELQHWNGDSTYWPNHIAKVARINNCLEEIQILLFGLTKYPFGIRNGFLGLQYIPLFNLKKIKFHQLPNPIDFDNARYLLFECSGGYPIGIFAMYVRSPIGTLKEIEDTQLFFMVGFNFYGNENFSKMNSINRVWEVIHNRVTANILNRFKQLCEFRFEKLREG